MICLDKPASQKVIAELIGVTRQAISEIESSGFCERSMPLKDWLCAYCSHLREVAAGRAGEDGLDLVSERALLAREQRMRIEMQNAVTRRELLPAILIEEVLAKAGSKVAGILDAIPGMVRRRVPALSAADIALIQAEVARARNIAAAIKLSDLADEPTDPLDELDLNDRLDEVTNEK